MDYKKQKYKSHDIKKGEDSPDKNPFDDHPEQEVADDGWEQM